MSTLISQSSGLDSPLSITSSIAGILTFLYALLAGTLIYISLLRSYTHSEDDIERFYEAFSACALESDLVRQDILASHKTFQSLNNFQTHNDPEGAAGVAGVTGVGGVKWVAGERGKGLKLDPNSLARLYEQVRAVEIDLQKQAVGIIERGIKTGGEGWVGKVLGRGRWLSRSKELTVQLAKREALTSRLLVVQMSLISA
jgi:hypothetical protein